MPYVIKLKSGRSIAVFFYDGPIARAIAFEHLLANGERLAGRLTGAFDPGRGHDEIVHVATDGESYGHHFQHGEMALAYALHAIENNPDVKLTIYAEHLEQHPPTHEIEIHQPSAWSCPHGVGRWKENCGCNSGGHSNWNQEWRGPLRLALDELRGRLETLFEARGRDFFKDPWAARNNYIQVILDRSPENIADFLKKEGARELSADDQVAAVRLLEMQRHAMLMYTSCGWFFDEISGIETVQVIQYAARAVQIASELGDRNVEPGFLGILEKARSNIPEDQNGRRVYEKFARPAVMSRENVAAHYAISSLFESYPDEARIYSYIVRQDDRQIHSAGNARLAIGRITVTFAITRSSGALSYAVMYLGDHNISCGAHVVEPLEDYRKFSEEARAAFQRADFPELVRLIDGHFGEPHYSIKNLFHDEQRRVLTQILANTREEIGNTYRLLTDRYAPLTRFLADLNAPQLSVLAPAAEFVLNTELRQQFDNGRPDSGRVQSLLAEARAGNTPIDKDNLAYTVKLHLDRLGEEFRKAPEDEERLQRFLDSASLLPTLPFEVNLWKPQNIYDQVAAGKVEEMKERDDAAARAWLEKFRSLGEHLGFHIERESQNGSGIAG